jgi:hypothetical protein
VDYCRAAAMAPAQTPEFEEFIQNIIAGEEEKIAQTLDQYPTFLEHSIPYSMVKSHINPTLRVMCDDSSLTALDLAVIKGHFNLFKSLHQRGYFSFNTINLLNILNVLVPADSIEELEYMLTHSPRNEDVIVAKVIAKKRQKPEIEKSIAHKFREKIEAANKKNFYIYDPPKNLPVQEEVMNQYLLRALHCDVTADQAKLLIKKNQWLLSAQITEDHINSLLEYLPHASDQIFGHLITLLQWIEQKQPDKPLSIFDFALHRQNSIMVNCLLELRPEFANEKTSVYTPLQVALWYGNGKIAENLLSHNADPLIPSDVGNTSLEIAKATNNPDLIALVQAAIKKEKLKEFAQDKLLAYNALVQNDLKTFEGLLTGKPSLAPGPFTPRMIAIGQAAVIKRCEQKGITDGIIEIPGKTTTLAQAAIKLDNPEALAIISRFNVPLDTATEAETFLHAAAANGSLKTVKYLLEQKVNPLAVDGRGRIASELAQQNHPQIARLIKSHEKLALKKQSSHEPSTTNPIAQQSLQSIDEIVAELNKTKEPVKKKSDNTQPKNPGKKPKSPAQVPVIAFKPETPAQNKPEQPKPQPGKKEKTEAEIKAAAEKRHQQNLTRQQRKQQEQKKEEAPQNEEIALKDQPDNNAAEKRKRKKEERKERMLAEQVRLFTNSLFRNVEQQIHDEDNLLKIAQAKPAQPAQPDEPIDPESAAALLPPLFAHQKVIIDLDRNYLTRKEIEEMLLTRCTVHDRPLVERLLSAISSQPRFYPHVSFHFENGVIEMDKLLKSYTGQETPPIPELVDHSSRNRPKKATSGKNRLTAKH